jgi:hypothetical protein
VSGHTKAKVIADGTTVYIDGGIQVHIAYCHDGDGDPLTDVGEANAKRIALAWNCHDELVEALELLTKFAEDASSLDYNEDKTLSWIAVVTSKAHKVIASARGDRHV